MDGGEPSLVFEKWRDLLPNIKKLMENGSYARMNSTIPPNTIVAWNSMISGRDTSELGVFSYTYKTPSGETRLVSSQNLRCKVMWDIIGEYNKRSIGLFVPLSYPVHPIRGCLVSDFLTPDIESNCAYPESLKEKIKKLGNTEVFFDVVAGLAEHKHLDPEDLIKRAYLMTDMQFTLLKDLFHNEKWDFFMAVMLGTDRLQHMLWRHFDETHRRFIANSPYHDAIKNYYIYIDAKLGELLSALDDDTVIIVASDHGMIKQEGKININNWLIEQGYLVLHKDVDLSQKQRFSSSFINMEKTIAYGSGAYNARVFINKQIVGSRYPKISEEIIQKLKSIPDDKGNPLDTKVYKAEDIYKNTSDPNCPDLTVYFDDLRWASNPDLGLSGLYSWESAMGADSAGHSRQGFFVISGKKIKKKGMMPDIDICQVAPTVMKILQVPIPSDLKVKPLEVFTYGLFS